jgi:hypothetical protein
MITNTGKSIIAKYLIGDTPAYASYVAVGCGAAPIDTGIKSGVSTATLSGTISSTTLATQVTGLSSTVGLVVGMTVTRISGTGVFGGDTTITSIDGPTAITVTSETTNTVGNLTFRTGGVAQVLSAASTEELWVGAKIQIIGGTGAFGTTDVIITTIRSGTDFVVTPGPTTNLSGATLYLQIDPNKNVLDFEMLRVPISSRGYVNDDGVNKIILTAQLPTEERYEISEIGIYSAGSNSAAGRYDSKTISAFSGEEPWQLVSSNSVSNASSINSNFVEAQNSIINGSNVISVDLEGTSGPETLQPIAIKTTTSNGIFSNDKRVQRYERPRYLSNVLLLKGNSSYTYSNDEDFLTYNGTPNFLQITGLPTDLSKNSSSDLIKLAFSIVAVNGESNDIPDSANIIVEFSNTDRTQYAWMQIEAKKEQHYSINNRYVVATKRLDELFYNTGQFSWKNVSIVRIYATTTDTISITNKALTTNVATLTTSENHSFTTGDYVKISGIDSIFNGIHLITGTPTATTFTYAKTNGNVTSAALSPNGEAQYASGEFYISLDALRLDNVNTVNPLYGLTGYSIIQNSDATTVVKSQNTSNYIEYRFILDVT